MTETVITSGQTTIGTVRQGDDGNWHAYDIADRLICSAATRQAATDNLLKVVRLAQREGTVAMAAQVLPFPAYRRQRFVAKQATRMACLSYEAAQNHLQHQLRVQADAMARKGVSEDLITEQQSHLERAIRAELWRLILCPGDQA